MKTIINLSIFLTVFLSFQSCSKEDIHPPKNNYNLFDISVCIYTENLFDIDYSISAYLDNVQLKDTGVCFNRITNCFYREIYFNSLNIPETSVFEIVVENSDSTFFEIVKYSVKYSYNNTNYNSKMNINYINSLSK